MKRSMLSCGLIAVGLLFARPVDASDEALRSSVVRIAVDKLVTRKTTAGTYQTKLESYVGSGFWVSGTNRIMTCAHVIDGARRVNVSRYAARASQKPWSTDRGEVALCLLDSRHDIAIIQVPEVGLGLQLSAGLVPAQAAIRSMGHTENYPWRLNEGHFTGTIAASQISVPLEGDVVVCDVSFGPGSSGGVIVDGNNHILGMIQGGREQGINGTRIAVPASTLQRSLQSSPSGPCHGGLLATGRTIMADDNTFADLISVGLGEKEALPARYWGRVSYVVMTGIDRFPDQVPGVRLDVVLPSTEARSWTLAVELGQRTVDRTLESGGQQIEDIAKINRLSFSGGPSVLLKVLDRVSVYSEFAIGYVHDRITHNYTFASPLFAPQSYDRPISGVRAGVGLDLDAQVVTNLRVGWSGELWQGSGGIGNGMTNRVGLRLGVGNGLK